MKALLPAVIAGSFAGWILTGAILERSSDTGSPEPDANREIRSILSPRSTDGPGVALPSDTELRTLEGFEVMLVRLEGASESDFKDWLRRLHGDASGSGFQLQMMKAIALHWASRDPEAALAFVRQEGMSNLRAPILQEWARSDMEAAFEQALSVSTSGRTAGSLMSGLDMDQREAYYQTLLDAGFDKSHPGFFGNVFGWLYRANPELAATGALEHALETSSSWSHGLDNVVRAWMKDDPDALLRWARSHTNPRSRDHALAIVAEKWIEKSPVEGMDLFWDELNHQQRKTITDRLEHSLPADVDALLTWVDEHVEALDWHGKIVTKLIKGLRNSDEPEKLAEILPRLDPEFSGLESAVGAAARKWAEKDADGLEKWMATLENEKLREAASNARLDHFMREDPMKAIAHLETLQDGDWSNDHRIHSLIDTAFRKLSEEGLPPEEIMAQLPEDLRDRAAMGYAQTHAREAPAETMTFLEAQPEGPERDRALQFTAGHWAVQDPIQAAEWVATLEEGTQKEYAMRNVAGNWARQDFEAAKAWINEQSSSSSRDRAFQEIVGAAQGQSPEDALILAQAITDDGQRQRSVEQAIGNIARQDPDRAASLLLESGLPEELVSKAEAEIAQQRIFKGLSAEH